MSAIGFVGAAGALLVGRSLIDTALFDTDTGAAAGRHADESRREKVNRQKTTSRIASQS